jgi:glycine hydroxymethyltransferase
MEDFHFRGSLSELDPDLYELTRIEGERQYRRLILIPSESTAPLAVRKVLASPFQNIYAEGYPPDAMRMMTEPEILDLEERLAYYRRYSDRRYYKGVEYANIVESLARRRCAEVFATKEIPAEGILVNVQALSGAPANNAVYQALVDPGDTVMGMDLLHGGHLTHGSPANRSGKLYNIVSYGVDPETEKIDFEEVEALARQHRPRLMIAGYSSYPWRVDWRKFREIADSVGAYLLADIAHVAGLVIAGVHPSPIGIADVITFTTHKSICGPRGAAILTTDQSLARKIDRAVFPGEQGGPHVNTMAAQALAFKLAATDQFKDLQRQIVVNCQTMASTLEEAGFRIPFGGTDTHLANVDVTSVKGPDGTPLSGDQAARILDLAGIVVNRNTIPGDRSAANPSGIRFGTPWVTQRGFKDEESAFVAKQIATVLQACKPYAIEARSGPSTRAKVDFRTLNDVRIAVRDLAQSLGLDFEPTTHGYPHFYYLDDLLPSEPFVEIQVEGENAQAFLRWVTDLRPEDIPSGKIALATLQVSGDEVEGALSRNENGERWSLAVPSGEAARVLMWLRDLSDGFVEFDPVDLHRKIPGPVVVRIGGAKTEPPDAERLKGSGNKPWFIGITERQGESLPAFAWQEPEDVPLKKTALYDRHKEMGAKMVPFAGWEMPVWYSSILEEHVVTREAAGLFDVSHMGVYQFEGREASVFLDCVVTNNVSGLAVGESLYAQILDPQGGVLDDTMVYRYRKQAYLVVVNASNDDKDWAWLQAVKRGEVRVDEARPWAKSFGLNCILRNLRDPAEGKDTRVDLALQGPKSREILLALGCDEETSRKVRDLKWAGVMEGVFGGHALIVSRTGYTGERTGFELFVHPEDCVQLWEDLTGVGKRLGLKPVGLGARDSLRTEAGLPLYGHEMAGEMGLGVGDAGFASYVKTHKPWFIGREAFLRQEESRVAEVVRFRFNDKGVRMAHYGDPVVDRRGGVIGKVTSCAVDREGYLLGQAYIKKKYTAPGTSISIFQGAARKASKAPAELEIEDRVNIPTPATVLSRFP